MSLELGSWLTHNIWHKIQDERCDFECHVEECQKIIFRFSNFLFDNCGEKISNIFGAHFTSGTFERTGFSWNFKTEELFDELRMERFKIKKINFESINNSFRAFHYNFSKSISILKQWNWLLLVQWIIWIIQNKMQKFIHIIMQHSNNTKEFLGNWHSQTYISIMKFIYNEININ